MRMTQSDKKLFLTIIIPEKFSSWTFSPLLQFILHQFYKRQHIKVWIQDICHSHTNKNDSIWQKNSSWFKTSATATQIKITQSDKKNSSWQLIIPKKFSSRTFSPLLRIILHQFKNNYNSIESNISYLRIHLYWCIPCHLFHYLQLCCCFSGLALDHLVVFVAWGWLVALILGACGVWSAKFVKYQ